ncbi:MAG TPA: twin-arginine translocase TatA/TatE family subunit [Salinarimonas sp.]|jgi:sec-independent protein translocase protein TatA|nr:twin-arginine translocase TatA/TatE family subunit [Salinarimonas sp.]
MGGASIWHWLVVGVIVLLLFGRGKVSEMMGDVAKGIKAFKKGMAEDEAPAATTTTTTTVATPATAEPVRTIEHQAPANAAAPAATTAPLGERKAG